MIELGAIDHVGIAVEDLDASVDLYGRLLGLHPTHRERIEDQGVDEVMFAIGHSFVQLLGALGPETAVGRSLSARGPGLHHVAYRVERIEAALEHLRDEGARLVDEAPRRGSRGTRIAFVHPKSVGGVLVELVEEPASELDPTAARSTRRGGR